MEVLDPAVFARSTCFEAGYLTKTNAGWRIQRPIIDAAACTGCLVCYMHCPDGAIFKVRDADCPIALDLDYCKGCGICATECRFGAISMADEAQCLAAEAQKAGGDA